MTVTQTYLVTGMSCQHCVHAVTEELTRLGGVSSVEVDLVPGGGSLVTVASETPLVEGMVRATLEEAGDYHLTGCG